MKIYKIHQETATVDIMPSAVAVATGSALYMGIDLHEKNWHVTIISSSGDGGGRLVFSSGMPGRWEVLKKVLDRYQGHPLHAVYEAGCFGYWLYDQLLSYGACCMVTPPSLIPTQSGNRVKTDRVDSTKLAVLLSKGMLKAVHVPTPEERAHRAVVRRRNQLVRDRMATQSRIDAELRLYHIAIPGGHTRWSKPFVRHLHGVCFADRWLQESFQTLVEEFDSLTVHIARQSRLLDQLAQTDRYKDPVRLLRTIPGIGLLTAMELLVELQDISRFGSAAHLASYCGLTPSQHSSGPHVRLGSITRMGQGHLRALLVESSWVLIRKDPAMARQYRLLQGRGVGAKKAIIAIAHKLLIRVRRILLDRTDYVTDMTAA